ncbi:hypothetical protein LB579_30495 [Mesorhizobium sp. BR1-1-7]|uniref:hypothetical protein n=1 Tax=Mesorhizobium sp. BR1-1-7 TaxID=2876647 RepID=UPI001CCE6751|nr:hypothetical protein [Mesorhizobium sp. BR1-1-7]MBZ9922024.1 hypothetical protein [Mesorhizobium sp. BR1-1-7]
MFDVFTGLPAEIEGHPYVVLEMDYAHEIAGILNAAARTGAGQNANSSEIQTVDPVRPCIGNRRLKTLKGLTPRVHLQGVGVTTSLYSILLGEQLCKCWPRPATIAA